jgi:O-succinylbenzoate synthase
MTEGVIDGQLRAPLRIDGAELRLVRLPLITPFTIATGTLHEKVFPLLTLYSQGLQGYAEGVMDPLPDYLEETVAGAMDLTRTLFLPQILGKSFENPQALHNLLSPWRGNSMSKAMVEMAFWDLWAKSLSLPLKTLLGGQADAVDVGVSLGIVPVEETLERVASHVAEGYKRIKLKIKPGHDVDVVSAVRARYPHIHLTADANSAYSLADSALLARLDEFDLDYIEQPLAWNDIHDHATLQKRVKTPICLDESIRSPEDARKALQSDAARVINIKVGRSGGYVNSLRIHDLADVFSVPVWCGGMLESGVGRAHNIHVSTLPNFRKPGDTSSASRYFQRDIVEQRLEAHDGRMPVPPGSGIGVTLDEDFLAHVTIGRESFMA